MSFVQLLCSPLSPRDACWVDLLPDQASLQASRRNTQIFVWLFLPFHLTNAGLSVQSFMARWDDAEDTESLMGIRLFVHIFIRAVSFLLLWSPLLLYARDIGLARGRHIVYFLYIWCLCGAPIVNAFFDPLGVPNLTHVTIRRFAWVSMFAAASVFVYRQVVVRMLLWALPGLLLYLIRACSDAIAASSSEAFPFDLEFIWLWDWQGGPLLGAGVSRSAVNQALVTLLLVAITFARRRWYARRSNQVQSITSTPTSIHGGMLGSISVVPDGSHDVDESKASSQTFSPHTVEVVGEQSEHHPMKSGVPEPLLDVNSCRTDWECLSASNPSLEGSAFQSHSDSLSISACTEETFSFDVPDSGSRSTASAEIQTNLTWNGCMLSCSACSRPPVLHPSLNGVWQMCPIAPGTPLWMHYLWICDLQFEDACGRRGRLVSSDGQVQLEGGSLRLLPNGMMQRKSRNSGVTTTFVRMPDNMDLSPVDALGSFHTEEEDARHETYPQADGDAPNYVATQTSEATHYYCICALPLFDKFDGFWHRVGVCHRDGAQRSAPESMKHLRICGTMVTDAHGQKHAGCIFGRSFGFAGGTLESDPTGGLLFVSPKHRFSFKKSLTHGSCFSNIGDVSALGPGASCEWKAHEGSCGGSEHGNAISFPDIERTQTSLDLCSQVSTEEADSDVTIGSQLSCVSVMPHGGSESEASFSDLLQADDDQKVSVGSSSALTGCVLAGALGLGHAEDHITPAMTIAQDAEFPQEGGIEQGEECGMAPKPVEAIIEVSVEDEVDVQPSTSQASYCTFNSSYSTSASQSMRSNLAVHLQRVLVQFGLGGWYGWGVAETALGAPTIRQVEREWSYGDAASLAEENVNYDTMKFVLVMCCGQGQSSGADDQSFWWADLPEDVVKTIAAMIGVEPKVKLRIIKTGDKAETSEVTWQDSYGRPGKIIKAWSRPCMALPQGAPLTSARQEQAEQDRQESRQPMIDVALGEPFWPVGRR